MKKDIFDAYASAIADQFHLSLDQMFTKTKRRDIVDARQMLYYLCMERPIRISYIQRFLEEHGHTTTHSTIIHGYKKAKELIESDQDFQECNEEEYKFFYDFGWKEGGIRLSMHNYKRKLDLIENKIRSEVNTRKNDKHIQRLKTSREILLKKYANKQLKLNKLNQINYGNREEKLF